MSTRSIFYLVVDSGGRIVSRCRIPKTMFPPEDIGEGLRILVPEDGKGPLSDIRVDMRKVRGAVTYVTSLTDVLRPSSQSEPNPVEVLQAAAWKRVDEIDREYAARFASVRGPLADLHAEKRRQAEAGGGPLIADEDDRLAITANAEAQDLALAAIERRRRDLKARIRAASSVEEIQRIVAEPDPDDRKSF